MTDATQNAQSDLIRGDRRSLRRRAVVAFALLALIAAVLAAVIIIYAVNETGRLKEAAYSQLGIIADSRKAAVETWLDERRADMLRVANQRAVQYFLVDRSDPEVPREAVDSRLGYVEDQLLNEAERGGFVSVQQGGGSSPLGGLVLLDRDLAVAAQSAAAPVVDPIVDILEESGAELGVKVLPAIGTGSGRWVIPMVAPVRSPEASTGEPIGFIAGFRPVDPSLLSLLIQPGNIEPGAQSFLIQGAPQDAAFLSASPQGGAGPLLSLAGNDGARSAFEVDGQQVLAIARTVPETAWTLIRTIGRDSALADGEERIRFLAGVLLLAVLLAVVCVVAVWRKAVSDRLATAANELSVLLMEADRLSRLLQRLVNAVPNGILAVDTGDRVQFGNRAALAAAGIEPGDAEGKDLVGVFGPGRAGPLLTANDKARNSGQTVRETDDLQGPQGRSVVLRSHVPLDGGGVLLVSEDMTEVVREREARAAQLDSLVDVLVDLIDARDSFASYHSRRVARLSRAMAERLDLAAEEVSAARTAARLMNLGKLRVDPALLTKTDNLTEEERERIRDSILVSAEMVSGISFDGPVVETLRQLRERVDGTGGPRGLSGADVLVTAQIVALANAYVAMISDRAHRAALSGQEALEQLWPQAGKVCDHKVIAALAQAAETVADG